MDDAVARRLLVAAARADFLSNERDDLSTVPDLVAASWRRCVSSGVRWGEVASDYHSDLDMGSRLVRCSQPVIEELADGVSDLPVSVALTDNRARILSRTDSDAWIGRVLDEVFFAPGFGYAEDSVGTNGVGTVLEFGASVHIVGPEHFVEPLQTFSCAGAPIRDPFSGRIEGVVDVSSLSEQSSPLMHSLVRSAAHRIERNLLLDRSLLQQALFDAYTRVDARCQAAVLAIGPRVVLANTTMRTLLDGIDQEELQDHLRFLTARRDTVDEHVELSSGRRLRLRGTRVHAGAETAGMVVVVTVLPDDDRPVWIPRQQGEALAPVPRNGEGVGPVASATEATGVGRGAPSRTPAWRTAAAEVEAAVRERAALLVLGEPGTGRFTLISESFHELLETGRSVALDADDLNDAPEQTLALLRTAPAVPTLYTLRGIDRLTPVAVTRLTRFFRRGPRTGAENRFAATGSDTSVREAPYQALLPFFHTSVTVPPLRHRGADLPALAEALLAELAPHREVRLTRDALRALLRYEWPGNVRQLKDALRTALSHRPIGVIDSADLPPYCHSAPRNSLRHIDMIERDAIVKALNDVDGNRVAAAELLGVARSTLYRKIKQYGITR